MQSAHTIACLRSPAGSRRFGLFDALVGVVANPVQGVRISGLVRRFGSRTALDQLDLSVAAGEVHALLGPNGAGKTTLVRVLAGLVDPSAGTVERAVRSASSHRATARSTCASAAART